MREKLPGKQCYVLYFWVFYSIKIMYFRQQNFAQKVAQFLGDFVVQKFSPWPFKSSPKGEILPNLVTLQIFDSSRLGNWNKEIHDKSLDSGPPIQVLSLPNVAALVGCSTYLAITPDRNKKRKSRSDCTY